MLSSVCQHFNVLGDHPLKWRTLHGMRSNLGIRSQLRRAFCSPARGEPSRYAAGDWVQVLDRESIQRSLDARSRTRGLSFLPYQWAFCEGVYRVQKVMQRIIDDDGICRPVSRTILLEDVDCGGPTGASGCGRRCPIMFRDEWVELAAAPAKSCATGTGAYVRVRSADEIRASLDWQGRRDRLKFMPEMYQWVGQRFRVAKKVERVVESGEPATTRHPFYILEGLQCSGAVLGSRGPCDRACSILWHADWLSHAA
jgi:hypothetical protein